MSRHIGSTNGEFSVVQFFSHEEAELKQEYVRAWVSIEEAVQAFRHYTSPTIAAQRLGFIKQVLIVDGFDCTAMEWKLGEGITFPTKEMIDAEMNSGEDNDYEKGPVSDEEFWA